MEHLGAWFGVERDTVEEETDEADAVMETDDRLRTRIQLAPQAFSTAGPIGAYKFHVLTAAPNVKSVAVTNPQPGYINIYPLIDEDDGLPDDDTMQAIRVKLNQDDIAPLTDIVSVYKPTVEHEDIAVTLLILEGPDPLALADAATEAIQEYADSRHRVGLALRLSGIYKAAQVAGVDSVIINEPTEDVDPGEHGAVYVDSITISYNIVSDYSH